MYLRLFDFFKRFFRSWRYGFISLLLALAIGLGNVQPSYGVSWLELMIRGIQVVQLSNISNAQEVELGKEINQELLSSGQAKIYTRSRSITSYINQIGQQLTKTSQRSDIPYTFQVVDDDSINAFATMGVYVYVNTGLIDAADNEAELASVI